MKKLDKEEQPWLIFEKQVASLLEKFGYETEHDSKISGAQTDVIAKSPRRTTPNLIVECKFHEQPKTKIGINEVENFIARVMKLRMEGEIDQGYLVTNTGFTSDARASLLGPTNKYIFLVTYDELFATLVNADIYLKSKIKEYVNSYINSRYVELRVIDTTSADGTIFDADIGLWNPNINKAKLSSSFTENYVKQKYWILPPDEIKQLVSIGCATTKKYSSFIQIDWPAFRRYLNESVKIEEKMRADQEQCAEEAYQKLRLSLANAKEKYARKVADRLGYGNSNEVIELLMQNPPEFPERLKEIIGLQKPPFSLRSIWDRYYNEIYKEQHQPVSFQNNSFVLTENAIAIGRENDSTELILLPMESILRSLNSFLTNTDKFLYVLLGDYGAGKTTVMQRLMYDLSQQKLKAKTDPTVRVPLLLNLREYNKVADFSKLIRNFLTDEADMRDLSLPMFRELNYEGHFVLLLDGFDEMLERVTKPDRRRCFIEIAQYISPKSKIVLAGRPGFFLDHSELSNVLNALQSNSNLSSPDSPIGFSLNCLQLMDGYELDKFINLSSNESSTTKRLIESNPSLYDLARRPVLTAMIVESAKELVNVNKKEITVRDLYKIYTDKWVQREEDKGRFRVLIDPEKKSTFVRYLAMEMHLTGRLSIPFRELGQYIQKYFQLDDLDKIDHFSHDIRTCSFLNRSDDGEYRFIHKSFMEFFVALEFERLGESPFVERFNKPLIPEMIAFLDPSCIPHNLLQKIKIGCNKTCELAQKIKEDAIKNEEFDFAAETRTFEQKIRELLELVNNLVYKTMQPNLLNKPTEMLNTIFNELSSKHDVIIKELYPLIQELNNYHSPYS